MSPSPISRAGHPPIGAARAIFLDLDGTLIAEGTTDFVKRPGADEFIGKCAKIGKVYLFTASTRNRAIRALASMGWKNKFEEIISRENVQMGRTPPTCETFVLVDNTPELAKIKMAYLASSPGVKFSPCGSLIEAMSGSLELPMDNDPLGIIVQVATYIEGEDKGLEEILPSIYEAFSDAQDGLISTSIKSVG